MPSVYRYLLYKGRKKSLNISLFRIRFFSRIRNRLSFWVRIPYGSGWRRKTRVKVKKNVFFFMLSTLKTIIFGHAPLKPYQNHISLLIDGSGSELLKPGSGSAKKTRIHPDPKHWNRFEVFLAGAKKPLFWAAPALKSRLLRLSRKLLFFTYSR